MEDSNWINHVALEQHLKDYVRRNLKRKEIPDFMKCNYKQYCCSTATSDRRRLRFFDTSYTHYDTSLETVEAAVQKELIGPSKFLGYRALNQKLRMLHEVQVPRNLVHKMLQNEDPEGQKFAAHLHKRREKDISLVRVRLMLYLLTVTRNCVGIKIGFSHWVCMDVLTLIPERSYFCASATRIQIL